MNEITLLPNTVMVLKGLAGGWYSMQTLPYGPTGQSLISGGSSGLVTWQPPVAYESGTNLIVAATGPGTGSSNILMGQGSGRGYTGSESNNILVGATGEFNDQNEIRIGNSTHDACFIPPAYKLISSTTALNVAPGGQLGIAFSSAQYKDNIQDLTATVDGLRPVSFQYKDPATADGVQYGLIAEEVEQHDMNLVFYYNGEPASVRYNMLIPVLLKEVQALKERVHQLELRVPLFSGTSI